MIKHLQGYLDQASKQHPEHWHQRMFATFHDPSGNIRVYVDIPGSWPRVVMLSSLDVAWSKVHEVTLMEILRKLRKDHL